MTEGTEAAKTVVDALSIGTVVATLAGILPSIAAIFTIFWTGIRIYETETVQGLMNRSKRKPSKDQE